MTTDSDWARDFELAKNISLRVKRRIAGFAAGEQRSPATGGGIEFADYREYAPGDDIRLLDWSVYLRSKRLLVKLCAEEKELTLVVILDASRSMAYGRQRKLELAKRITAVLAASANLSGNRSGIAVLGPVLLEPLKPDRSKVTLSGIAKTVRSIACVESPSPASCIRQFASKYGRKCIAVLISDFLYPGWESAIRSFAASGCEAHVLHLVAPEEIDPPLRGEATLVDMEDLSETPIHADESLLSRYKRAMSEFITNVRSECVAGGMSCTLLTSDTPIERVFYEELRKGGVVW
jgi:uncharacterized protein (DUF58 family)